MLSRRKFLQTQAAGIALPFTGASAFGKPASDPQQNLPVVPPTGTKRDYWRDWPRYLTEKMNAARARRKTALAEVRSADDVRERIRVVRSKVWELMGGQPEKTPLNPQIVGKIERDGYRIEKVIFESRPQVFVTANLYMPTGSGARVPGILAPLGHTRNGKSFRNYQYVYQTLARMGCAVIAFDPFGQGERFQYLDPKTGAPTLNATGEHSQAGRPLLLLGGNFAGYRGWDGIRALDYLLTRPEIDSERIGCVGQSGGATMTMFLACLEPRIHAAVEVDGNSENVAGPIFIAPGPIADAEQDLVGGLPFGIDRGDLLMAFAPKPLLMCYTHYDAGQTYSPLLEISTREIFDEAKQFYQILGAEEKIGLFASPLPHDFDFFNRQATYRWFNRWLKGADTDVEEAEFDESPPGALDCTPTGQVLTSLGGRSVVQVNMDLARTVIPESPFRDSSADAGGIRENLCSKLKQLLALPEQRTPLNAQVLTSNVRKGARLEFFEFYSEGPVRVPGWFVKPQEKQAPVPVVLVLTKGAIGAIAGEPGQFDGLVRQGYAVCAIELRGRGIAAPNLSSAGPDFYLHRDNEGNYTWANLILGKPILGQHVWDVLRTVDYLTSRADVDHSQISILAEGGNGLTGLMTAVLDDRLRSLMLHQTVVSYRSVIESPYYSVDFSSFAFGMLRQFDIPDLVGAMSPRPCWVLNATNASGQALAESEVRDHYSKSVDLAGGSFKNVRFAVESEEKHAEIYLNWLNTVRS